MLKILNSKKEKKHYGLEIHKFKIRMKFVFNLQNLKKTLINTDLL